MKRLGHHPVLANNAAKGQVKWSRGGGEGADMLWVRDAAAARRPPAITPERLERNRCLRRGRPHARERAQPSAASAAVWLRPTSSVAARLGLSDTLVELEITILDS